MPDLQRDQEFVQMFYDEAQIASQLNHPNVVQIYELGELDDSLFISMELLRGVNLRDLLARLHHDNRKIPIEIACRIFCGALEGLGYAHNFRDESGQAMNIIHRDVSPQNIIVTYDGIVKLVDFGVAKAEGKLHQTRAGLVKGKFAYMSPEQVNGGTLDGRSDLFALTEVFYELLLHRHPFFAENDMDVLRLIIDSNPPHPTAVDQSFPAGLADILVKAMKKQPEHRYPDAQSFQKALEQFMIESRNPATTMTVGQFVRDLFSDRMALEQKARERNDQEMLVDAMTVGRAERWEMTGSALVGSSQMMAFGHDDDDEEEDGYTLRGDPDPNMGESNTEETEITLAGIDAPVSEIYPIVHDNPPPVEMGEAMVDNEDPAEAPTMMGEFSVEDINNLRQKIAGDKPPEVPQQLPAGVSVEPITSEKASPIISRSGRAAQDPASESLQNQSTAQGKPLTPGLGRRAPKASEVKTAKPQFLGIKAEPSSSTPPRPKPKLRSKNQLEIWFFVLGLGALIGALVYAGILIFTTNSTIHLVIRSEPAGAEIWLDGFNTGYKTPKEIPNLSAETPHRIELKREGYKTYVRQIKAEPENRGEPYVINKLLDPFQAPKPK